MAQDKENLFGKKLADVEKQVLERHMAQAYVLIDCKKMADYEVLRNLSLIPEVIEGDVVMGSYKILCRIVAPTYNNISDVVTKKLRKLEGIKATITLNVVEK